MVISMGDMDVYQLQQMMQQLRGMKMMEMKVSLNIQQVLVQQE